MIDMNVNFLFVAVLLLFIFLMIRGYKKGFLRMVIYFGGMIIILVATKRLSPGVCQYVLDNTGVYTTIRHTITEKYAEKNSERDNTISENQIITIKSYSLPEILESKLIANNTREMYSRLLVQLFDEYVSAYLARISVNALVFIIMFCFLLICFKLLLNVVDIISKIPIIKGLNKMAGSFLGLVEALLITWLVFFVVIIFIGNDVSDKMIVMINSSSFLTEIFNSNFFFDLL